MNKLIDFYKGLDALNLVLFWGIIVVIILIVAFVIVLVIKKKKNKEQTIDIEETESEEEIDNQIPLNISEKEERIELNEETPKEEPVDEVINEEIKTPEVEEVEFKEMPPIEEEKKFVAEEHVLEYDNDLFNIPGLKKNNQIEEPKEEKKEEIKEEPKEPFSMPTRPYERNVLREMSLSQTSPIGLTINKEDINKNTTIKNEETKDLSDSIKENLVEETPDERPVYRVREEDDDEYDFVLPPIEEPEITPNATSEMTSEKEEPVEEIEPTNYEEVEMPSMELDTEPIEETITKEPVYYEEEKLIEEETEEPQEEDVEFKGMPSMEEEPVFDEKPQEEPMSNQEELNSIEEEINEPIIAPESISNEVSELPAKEDTYDEPIFENIEEITYNEPVEETIDEEPIIPIKEPENTYRENEQYLEEVSRKLAEAEVPDSIERTEYEKKQEEEAIISYKELMEKKDSIEPVDEEDAVISIEELMQRKENEDKLYNFSDQEDTDDFISELKQFRDDLE